MGKSAGKNAKQKNLRQWKDAHKRVRAVLLEHWDPIGVGELDAAQDEYDSIIPRLIQLLASDATDGEIVKFLSAAATAMLGPAPNQPRLDLAPVLAALRKIQ